MKRSRFFFVAGLAFFALIIALWERSGSVVDVRSQAPLENMAMPTTPPPSLAHVDVRSPHANVARAPEASPDAVEEATTTAHDAGAAIETLQQARELRSRLAQNAADAEKNLDTYCEASARLSRRALFLPSSRNHDAAAYLTVRVDWEGDSRPPGLLHLPEALSKRVADSGEDWLTKISEADFAQLDFSWLATLHQYDHWNVLLGDGPLRDYSRDNYWHAPIPNFLFWVHWAQLRLAAALRTRDMPGAAHDVRHMAYLCHSTELLIGDMIALRLLTLERQARAFASAQGQAIGEGESASADDLEEYKKLSFTARRFQLPGVPAPVKKRALQCGATPPCVAIYEGTLARHALAEIFPPEATETAPGTGCNEEVLRRLQHTSPVTLEEANDIVGPLGSFMADGGGR
ncbi:MAG: hypothetical protein K1X64_11760 [Myxococcaceae bacterium]|nr:hypothetical protein [Myxococcaceae bacterium]